MGRRWIWGLAAVVLAILLGCSPPPPEGRCRDNRDCDALGEMCRKPAGECDALGSCTTAGRAGTNHVFDAWLGPNLADHLGRDYTGLRRA